MDGGNLAMLATHELALLLVTTEGKTLTLERVRSTSLLAPQLEGACRGAWRLDMSSVRFLYDGERIGRHQTAQALEMCHHDVIDVMMAQGGSHTVDSTTSGQRKSREIAFIALDESDEDANDIVAPGSSLNDPVSLLSSSEDEAMESVMQPPPPPLPPQTQQPPRQQHQQPPWQQQQQLPRQQQQQSPRQQQPQHPLNSHTLNKSSQPTQPKFWFRISRDVSRAAKLLASTAAGSKYRCLCCGKGFGKWGRCRQHSGQSSQSPHPSPTTGLSTN